MSVTVTTPSGLSYKAISEYAERVGEKHGIYDPEGVANIDALVEKLGGTVRMSDGRESLHVRERGNFVISVPATTSHRRDRFTIAHELGHYFLHYLLPRSEDGELPAEERYGRGGRSQAETEANVFAASLLMPESHFRRQHRKNGDPWMMAKHFEVSPAAAEVRAQVLNLQ